MREFLHHMDGVGGTGAQARSAPAANQGIVHIRSARVRVIADHVAQGAAAHAKLAAHAQMRVYRDAFSRSEMGSERSVSHASIQSEGKPAPQGGAQPSPSTLASCASRSLSRFELMKYSTISVPTKQRLIT